ncbi:hypothetical protein EN802_13560 [bacterium M00.F.Ca.ET.159.01.1.1]|nr:hypothetical protein EN802_13560 [bacterium M00.F.Ca.ET.159.01.1.1]
MFWNIVIGILSYAIQLALTPKPPNAKPKSLEDFQAPTAEEGREIPVVFGTSDIQDPNVTWYGDLKRDAIKGARRYGLFGPRQILGYKYSLGMQMSLCHGPADALYRITVGDKTAWRGNSTGGRININKANLFGGNQSEGGIAGAVDLNMGAPDQLQDDYLVSKLGATISAFRGIVTVVLRQVYLGTSNYIKPWEFRLQRIHLKSDGTTQWYDAKAAIPAKEISSDDPGREALFEVASKPDDTNGDYAAAWSAGVLRTWFMPDGTAQTATVAGTLFSPAVHITDFNELVVRSGGNSGGSAPTFLEFRDVANPNSLIQTIDLDSIVSGAGGGNLNFGFIMADVSVASGAFALVGILDGATSNVRVWILLERVTVGEIDEWGVSDTHTRVNSVVGTSFSMGRTYAYRALNGSTQVLRLTWNGTWAEDIVTLPGISGTALRAVAYNEAANQVVVINASGGIFVYSEDLSTLIRSSTGNSGRLGTAANSLRMSMGSATAIVADASAGGAITRIYFVQLADLALDTYIDVANSQFVRKDFSMSSLAYNQSNGYVVAAGGSPLVFWLIAATVFDMNPAHIIRECLTDGRWGMGYNDADIDDTSFTACADTFFTELFGLSLRWSQEEEIQEFVSTILSHVDAYLYVSRSTGKFVLKAIRNDYDIDLIPVLTEDDVVEWTEIDHRSPAEAVSSVLVKFYLREKRKTGAHLVTNLAQAMQATKVQPATKEYPGINRSDLAIKVATRDVIALGSGLTSGRLIAKRTVEGLNPGDPFRLVSARHDLSGEVMRVADLNFGDGRQNKIGIKFLPDVFNLGAAVLVDDTDSPWVPPSNDPQAVNPRLVWEMPYREMRQMVGDADLASLLSGDTGAGLLQVAGVSPTSDALNADVMVDAGSGYAGTEQMDFAPGGFISGALAINATTVTINSGSGVNSSAIGLLATIGDGSRYGTEVVRIDGVSGTTLTIARGFLDTVPIAHPDGVAFILFDDLSTSDFETYTDGETINVKMLTNTGHGQLAAAPVDSFTFASRGIRPSRPRSVTVNTDPYGPVAGSGLTTFAVSCVESNRLIELDPLPAWTDPTEAPESGQTIVIEVLDPTGTSVVTTHSGLTISDIPYSVPIASFGGNSSGFIRVGAARDGFREWQAHRIEVLVGITLAAGVGNFTLTGMDAALSLSNPTEQLRLISDIDELDGNQYRLTSGDQQSGTDKRQLSGDQEVG